MFGFLKSLFAGKNSPVVEEVAKPTKGSILDFVRMSYCVTGTTLYEKFPESHALVEELVRSRELVKIVLLVFIDSHQYHVLHFYSPAGTVVQYSDPNCGRQLSSGGITRCYPDYVR